MKTLSLRSTALWALLTISAAFNFLQGIRISELERVNEMSRQTQRLVIGSDAPDLEYTGQIEQPVRIDFSNRPRPTLVYFYTERCHWCSVNSPNFVRLSEQLTDRYEIISVCIKLQPDDCRDTPEKLLNNVSSLPGVSVDIVRQFDVTATPTLVSISSSGKVERIWKGAFSGERRSEMENFLGVQLEDVPTDISSRW